MLFLKLPGDSLYHIQEKFTILQACLQAAECWGLILLALKGAAGSPSIQGNSIPIPRDAPLKSEKFLLAAKGTKKAPDAVF